MRALEDLDTSQLASNWMARCVENGVPLDDYLTTTATVSSWLEWCDAWVATADQRLAAADDALRHHATLTAAELRLVAALEYHFAKFLFVHDMQTLRTVHARAVSSYRQAMVDLPWPGRQLDVELDGAMFPGVIRRPQGDHELPAVVIVPGLDATKEEMHRLQEVFLRRGMATFTFDGPGQGESEFDHPLRPDWEHVATAALDVLEREPDIDGQRLAMVGVSLGGYFAARAACVEPRLRAAASIGGCYSLGECWAGLPALTRQAFAVRSGANDEAEAAARADEFSIAPLAATADVPFLVLHGGHDRLFDTGQAERLAAHFDGAGSLIVEPDGNHVLHNLAVRTRPLVADWIARELSAAPGAAPTRGARRRLWHAGYPGAPEDTLLLLHSLALDSSVWDGVLPRLLGRASVITCDLPGHGRSPSPAPTTIDDMADAVADLVRAEATGRVVACGLSLGGCVAQSLAARHPKLVSGLALVDTTAWYGPTAAEDWRTRSERARTEGLASLADFQLAGWFSPGFRDDDPDQAARLLQIFARNDLADYANTCQAMGTMDLRDAVQCIAVPTAVLVGELDPATPVSHAEDLARRIPEASLTILEGCGHLSPLEAPGRFADEVFKLIERCVAAEWS